MNVVKEGVHERGEPGGRSEGKTITMAMIAKAAGVSQGAISSLLNDRDYGIRVSPKTRERVFRVCREMGYIPNDLRAVVRMYPETGDFCLLIADSLTLDDPMADRLSKELIRQMPGHHLVIASYHPDTDYVTNPGALPAAVRTGVSSKFVTIGTPNPSLFSAITLRECAVIHVGQEVQAAGVTSIVPDYAAASRQGIEYLFANGHRQVAILSGPFGSTDPSVIELNYGVRAGYDAIRTPIEAQNVIYGDATFEHGVTSMDLLLERQNKPTAVFCFTDLVAAGALHRAQERGLNVPGDLSIIGCGNASFSPLLHPPLTTVALPAEKIAEEAIAEVYKRIKEQDITAIRKIGIGSHVVERSSCAVLEPVHG